MTGYSVELEPNAERQLLRLDLTTRRRVITQLKRLLNWPVPGKSVRPLKGSLGGLYRMRIGDYRAIFAVDEQREIISVREIGHRGDIYE
ncbi:MAG: type II toxin-antitoxin system RelE/ParE family toxin [Armatimonadota bacterium]